MGQKTIIQMALILVAVLIMVTYIKPTFVEIGELQDEVFEYQDAVAKASEFNNRLRELQSIENSFSNSDLEALDVFLPYEINESQVMADIITVSKITDVTVSDVKAGELITPAEEVYFSEADVLIEQSNLLEQNFDFSLSGSYESIKDFFSALERNAYVLTVEEAAMTPLATGSSAGDNAGAESEYTFTLSVTAYALAL